MVGINDTGRTKPTLYDVVKVPVASLYNNTIIDMEAIVVKDLPDICATGIANYVSHINKTHLLKLADPELMEIKDNIVSDVNLLIGSDNISAIFDGNKPCYSVAGLTCMPTKFGDPLMGRIPSLFLINNSMINELHTTVCVRN